MKASLKSKLPIPSPDCSPAVCCVLGHSSYMCKDNKDLLSLPAAPCLQTRRETFFWVILPETTYKCEHWRRSQENLRERTGPCFHGVGAPAVAVGGGRGGRRKAEGRKKKNGRSKQSRAGAKGSEAV